MGSVIKRTSIPILHSSAALLKLVTMGQYSGPSMIIVKSLIEKRYAMPTKVVEALVEYFASFASEERTLPLLWHQTLHIFVKTYKQELSRDQKNKIFSVCRKHVHHGLTPEIRRELTSTTVSAELAPIQPSEADMKE